MKINKNTHFFAFKYCIINLLPLKIFYLKSNTGSSKSKKHFEFDYLIVIPLMDDKTTLAYFIIPIIISPQKRPNKGTDLKYYESKF